MSKLLNLIIYLAISMLFICLLSLIIFFVANPSIFKNTKDVLTYIFSFFSITSLLAYLLRNIRKERKKQGNYTGVLIEFFRKEPLFHIFIWIFIFIELILFCYILPIHYVNIEIGPNKKAELIKNGDAYILDKPAEGKQKYKSPRFLSWNEKACVRAHFSKNCIDTVNVTWSAFAFIYAFRGVQLPRLPLQVEIKIEKVTPKNATIHYKTSKSNSAFKGAGSFKAEKCERITIIVKADSNYESLDTSFISAKDTTLEFTLEQVKGSIKLTGRRENGEEIKEMDIYLYGKKHEQNSSKRINLKPGSYKIYLKKDLPGNGYYKSETVTINVLSHKNPEQFIAVELF